MFDFLSKAKKLSLNNKYKNNSSDIEKKASDLNLYLSVIDTFKEVEFKNTDKQVSLLGIKLGMSKKKVKSKLGSPKSKVSLFDNKIKVFSYKKHIGKKKTEINFHFYKKKLFSIEVEGLMMDEQSEQDFLEALNAKYGFQKTSKEMAYKDKLNNILFINYNKVMMRLNYFSLNDEVVNYIKNEELLMKKGKKNREERRKRYYYDNI